MDVAIAQKLSARVETALRAILGNETDDFDLPEWDATTYINQHFPDEQSLNGIDRQIAAMDIEIKELDESILESVREQSTAGRLAAKDIADAKDSIGDLHGKILEIKRKAEVSEVMVQEICRDIRQLDVAKKHLTNTIMTLARLKTLASAVEQLRGHAARRSYEEAAPLLEAAVQLFLHFGEYRDVPKVSELANGVEKIREELREAISEDFDILVDCAAPESLAVMEAEGAAEGGRYKIEKIKLDTAPAATGEEGGSGTPLGPRALTEDNIQTLYAACEVVDALGPTVRRSIIKAFIRKQMKPYSNVFHRGSQYGDSLDGVEKRFAWFRRALRDVEARYGRILPAHWRVLHRLCIEFCEATRVEIDRVLNQYDPPSSAPADALLRALMKTLAFEKEMTKRFEKGAGGTDGAGGDGPTPAELARMMDGGDAPGSGPAYDESAPLYNAKGELVDPASAEGIRLKYRRKKEWEERSAADATRAAQRQEKRQWWASLAGGGGPGGPGGGSSAVVREDDSAALPKLSEPGKGIISEVFAPYMGAYVKFERATIDAAVASSSAEDFGPGGVPIAHTASAAGSSSILRSSTQLFFQSRNAVTRCVQLNAGATLFSLFKEIKDAFAMYAAGLEARMPKPIPVVPGALPGETYDVPEASISAVVDTLCLVVSTAEYCGETIPALCENIKKNMEESYRKHVGAMEETQELFFTLQGAALKTMSGVVACMLDPALSKLSKHPWSTVTEVGDQSAYVADMGNALRSIIPRVRARSGEAAFRNFCDKFGRAFMSRYQSAIFRCKRVGETGAQQLLLDAQAIRTLLLTAPSAKERPAAGSSAGLEDEDGEGAGPVSTGGEGGAAAAAPPVYAKFVLREMPRVEMLLKIIACPKERFGETIKALWPEVTKAELDRVMDLKALTKKEQIDVSVQLGLMKAPAPSSVTSSLGGIGGALGLGSVATAVTGSGSSGSSSAAGGSSSGGSSASSSAAAAGSAALASMKGGLKDAGGMAAKLFTVGKKK